MIYLRKYGGGSKQNERRTLKSPVCLGNFVSQIADNQVQVKVSVARFVHHAPVHLWDFGVKASESLSPGDVAYILCEDTLYYSTVFEKIADPNGVIGDLVGWHRIQQAPWRNPIVLKPLVLLDALAPAVALLSNKTTIEENFFRLSV